MNKYHYGNQLLFTEEKKVLMNEQEGGGKIHVKSNYDYIIWKNKYGPYHIWKEIVLGWGTKKDHMREAQVEMEVLRT